MSSYLAMRRKSRLDNVEKLYVSTQWQLMYRKLRKHKLAMASLFVLLLFYLLAFFCEFFSPFDKEMRFGDYFYTPPQRIHFIDQGKFSLRPFVYGLKVESDAVTWQRTYVEDKTVRHDITFFTHGVPYRLWGLFPSDIHLFGTSEGPLFLLGSDRLGRDLFSRQLYAARISLTIGLIGVTFSFMLGCLLGGISGFYGGTVDIVVQRIIEFLICIPTIPLWMSLSAALPTDWSSIKTYFGITIILSFVGWCGLARVVRGKVLELRGEDFVMAAKIAGTHQGSIIARHILPSFLSYLIVHLTLSIPGMILGETALSFLGLGIRPPAVSWGALLQDAMNVQTVALNPWLLTTAAWVIVTALAFNFLGDGLRDAADPYR
jgi:peptide/nickel transport system permease protein